MVEDLAHANVVEAAARSSAHYIFIKTIVQNLFSNHENFSVKYINMIIYLQIGYFYLFCSFFFSEVTKAKGVL